MKLTQSKSKDLMATITVDVAAADYNEKVEKVLKDYRKTAEVPGFRKGKTPMGIIVKQYRIPVLADEVNKMLQNELYKYISDEKVKVLGSPMPVENQSVDWENDTTFNFEFEIGIAPEIDVKPPLFDPEEILGVVPADVKIPMDVRELIMRITEGSELSEFKPEYGNTMVCGWT